ncbi:MAG: FtsQ-type POTRA domain-containing protein [Candidatus Kapaibacterium sp.]
MSKGRILLLIVALSIITVLIIVLANNWRNKTLISKITIKGNITISENDILFAAGLRADSTINLDELNEVFIRDRVAKHPEIKKVVVSKEPPSELIIEVVEKKPIAIVIKNNEIYLIDEEQEIFPIKNYDKAFDLPIINGLGTDDRKSKADINTAMNFLKATYEKGKYIQNLISEVNMKDSSKIIVKTNDKLTSFYFKRVDKNANEYYKPKLELFKRFMDEEITLRSVNCEYVDMRFSNQIIAKIN